MNKDTVQAGDVVMSAPLIVINTGKSSVAPAIPGLDTVNYLTYESFWELAELPQRILVVGGGYVGVELGQGLVRLGCETHIIEPSPRIISREEEDVSRIITQALRKDGAHIHTRTEVSEVRRRGDSIEVLLKEARPRSDDGRFHRSCV